MLSDIVALSLAIVGMIFILFLIIFKMLVWKSGDIIISIPLNFDDKEIYNRILNIRELCALLGIQMQCTIAVVNYGASDNFINKLKNDFSQYGFLKIIYKDQPIKELHT